jgi:RNA polymerase sigma-70 factor (ECF subfamily)
MSDSVTKLSVVSQVENTSLTLEQFLIQTEQRAYRTALLTTRRSADALDIVQDAMLQLVQHYRERPAQEWPLVFQRILQHRIMDWHRQQARSKKWFWQQPFDVDDESEDVINHIVDEREQDPAELLARASDIKIVLNALENLPVRQRQAFMLRAWEGFDVRETATAMECSEGSVKTHYFRALQTIRDLLLANA